MNQKTIGGLSIIMIVIAAGAFYGGTVYAGKKSSTAMAEGAIARGQRGAPGAGFGQGQGNAGRAGAGGGFASGEVLSKDANSITLKLQDGGSKIVLFSTSTRVGKMTDGSIADVVAGTQVTITGAANADGSVTANNVQIRPAGSEAIPGRMPPAAGQRQTP